MDEQPALRILKDRGFSVARLARAYGLDRNQLDRAVRGRIVPSHEVRVALTAALDEPVTELFSSDVLTKTYAPRPRRESA